MALALRLRLIAVVGLLVGLLAGVGVLTVSDTIARAQRDAMVDLSLHALGYSDQVTTGQTSSFDVYLPALGSQPGDSQLVFVYSHADILLPDISLVSVLVNNTPVYSARLDASNVDRTTVTINIPADRFQVGPNRVSVRFALRLRQDCDGDTSPARHAIVYNDTTLRYGPPANPSPPDLRDFPGQFTSQTRLNAVIADRATAVKGQPTISVPLRVAEPQALRGLNAIAIGFPSGNPVLDPIAGQLFFVTGNGELRLRDMGGVQTVGGITPVASAGASPAASSSAVGGTTIAGGTAIAMPSAPASSPAATGAGSPLGPIPLGGNIAQFTGGGTGAVGVLQILPAPWGTARFLLVIAGGTPDRRALAIDALTRSRFDAREAVISTDMLGQLTVGEARSVPQPTLAPPPATAAPTVIGPNGAAMGGIIVSTPGAADAASTPPPGSTISPSIATAIAGGGVGAPMGTTASGTSAGTGPGTLPGGATTAALIPGGVTLATIPVSGTASGGTVNTPTVANTPAAVSTPAAANTPAAAGSAASTPATGGPVATPPRPAGTPAGTTPPGTVVPLAISGAIGASGAGTPASGTIPGVTQIAGTRAAGTGAATAGPGTIPGNTATQTATAFAGAATGDHIFGLPRTLVFGIAAAAALALGIVVIALFLSGQRRAE